MCMSLTSIKYAYKIIVIGHLAFPYHHLLMNAG